MLVLAFAASAAARAQGGPPMVTDDPGTPGDHHWEINLAWTETRTPGASLLGAPLLDANYGLGDRIQLNYQASWNILDDSSGTDGSGMSDSQLAVKWRYYDAGPNGLQLSTYPRVFFATPGSPSDRPGISSPDTTFLLPLEALRDFGWVSLNADFGRMLGPRQDDEGWTGGLCAGRRIVSGWELDAEVHFTSSDGFAGVETLVNLGTRYDLSKDTTLLLSVGRDIHDSLGPRASLLAFAGIQIRI